MNILFTVFFIIVIGHSSASRKSDDCKRVPPMCHKLIDPRYTTMRLPNMLNHSRRTDVENDIRVWTPLLNSSTCNRHDKLKKFLCITYAPVCVKTLISPCKSLCESVRDSCDPVMKKHNHSWPAIFDCNDRSKFLDDSSQLCINESMLGRVKNDCPCKRSYSRKALNSFICKSDFVIRGRVTAKTTKSKNVFQIAVKFTNRPLYQKPNFKRALRGVSIKLRLPINKDCQCRWLRKPKAKNKAKVQYLYIIGSKVGGKMRVKAMLSTSRNHRQTIARITAKISKKC